MDIETQNWDSNLRELVGHPGKFCYEDLKMATNDFQFKLGSGASGSVFKGYLTDGTPVAVKRVEWADYGERVYEAEISAIPSVQHDHLVCIRGYCSHMTEAGRVFFIVYDLFHNGSLDNWIFPVRDGQSDSCLSWKLRYMVAIDVAKALAYLHGQRIFHLDVKPENILLDDEFGAVVSDFGLSRLLEDDEGSVIHTAFRGTKGYMAPEWYSEGHGISKKSDIFSYGKVLLDLFFGQRYVCLDKDGNDIYLKSGNSQLEQRTFLKFMWEKLAQKKLVNLIDKRLMGDGGVDEKETNCLVHAALLCLDEDPDKRLGDMQQVVDMLEAAKLDGKGEFRYRYLEWATANFRSKLGSGGLGSVFKGQLNDGTVVAVKRIEWKIYREREFQDVMSSIASLQHDRLIRLHGHCSYTTDTGTVSLIVYDHFPKGSLDKWIFPLSGGQSGLFLSLTLRIRVADEVAKALAYLHRDCNPQILHLDLKPEIILLDDNLRAVVSGTGISKLKIDDRCTDHSTLAGTDIYVAPEWFSGNGISEKCDVYSYGVLLLDMFFGERNVCLDNKGNRIDKDGGNPQKDRLRFYQYMEDKVVFKKKELLKLIDNRLKEDGEGLETHEAKARTILYIALMCLRKDPEERPSMSGVVNCLHSPWLMNSLSSLAVYENYPSYSIALVRFMTRGLLKKIRSYIRQFQSPNLYSQGTQGGA
ncbi:hypothetical protein GIB67_010532 [Kingdonia uniflora]|uniref:non-specific serine/threonine protein kinase n=1 Tax=Kingdonia uniflora TaxID=39325 RepID=A0A7J7MB31_9MAGN|nr:hypothetical protein GIB67_010532 [Kingdonia uniflora]